MRYRYVGWARKSAGLMYFILGFMLATVHFETDMGKRIDGLWFIYMNAMYLEQSAALMLFVAFLSVGMWLAYHSGYFTDFSARPKVAAVLAGLAVLLLVIAVFAYSRPVILLASLGAFCAIWVWKFELIET